MNASLAVSILAILGALLLFMAVLMFGSRVTETIAAVFRVCLPGHRARSRLARERRDGRELVLSRGRRACRHRRGRPGLRRTGSSPPGSTCTACVPVRAPSSSIEGSGARLSLPLRRRADLAAARGHQHQSQDDGRDARGRQVLRARGPRHRRDLELARDGHRERDNSRAAAAPSPSSSPKTSSSRKRRACCARRARSRSRSASSASR